jgi:hypothetical protein
MFCDNTPGSFECRCPAFYAPNVDGGSDDCSSGRVERTLTGDSRSIKALPFGDDLIVAFSFAGPAKFAGMSLSTGGDYEADT